MEGGTQTFFFFFKTPDKLLGGLARYCVHTTATYTALREWGGAHETSKHLPKPHI